MLEGRDRPGVGAALIDRGGDAGMDPGVVRRQPESGHPFEDMDVQIDPARRRQLAGEVDHLLGVRCEAGAEVGDPVARHGKIADAIKAGRRVTNLCAGQYQVIKRLPLGHFCLASGSAAG